MRVLVPWHHVDALAHGPWDFILEPFRDWLHTQKSKGVRLIVMPRARNFHEQFSLAFASISIREEAIPLGLMVMSENRLRRAGIPA